MKVYKQDCAQYPVLYKTCSIYFATLDHIGFYGLLLSTVMLTEAVDLAPNGSLTVSTNVRTVFPTTLGAVNEGVAELTLLNTTERPAV